MEQLVVEQALALADMALPLRLLDRVAALRARHVAGREHGRTIGNRRPWLERSAASPAGRRLSLSVGCRPRANPQAGYAQEGHGVARRSRTTKEVPTWLKRTTPQSRARSTTTGTSATSTTSPACSPTTARSS